ncbi:MAG: 3'-5' exonuclease domain-containing protein 2 [Bacteroidota bacterium]|nr:MAG: 3'-5' exonuclease domain-containing protein 2 [Bacteroidota bacterium]
MRNEFSFKPAISNEDIAGLPIGKFTGLTYYIDSLEKFDQVIDRLEQEKMLGFDTETKPSFKKGQVHQVSLLQFCSSKEAYLFRINKIGLPKQLVRILANDSIIKAGVAIHDDIATLRKIHDFKPAGFVELQQFVKGFGIEDNSLKKLSANILGFSISKRQQTSNWESDILSPAQIEYATTDAWVCHEIYKTLIQ